MWENKGLERSSNSKEVSNYQSKTEHASPGGGGMELGVEMAKHPQLKKKKTTYVSYVF